MPSTNDFVAHCVELLAPLGAVHTRRMFGGHGLYVDSIFIALIADDRLYLKSDDVSRPAFERAGCTPFAYSRRDRGAVTLGYWTPPDEALDSPQAMQPWARLALAAALRAKSTDSSAAPVQRKTAARKARAPARTASTQRKARARG